MKRRVQRGAIATALLFALAAAAARDSGMAVPSVGSVNVYFTPWDDAQSPLLNALDGARSQILVQAFLLTSRAVSDSLIAAHRRGVNVRVLADAQQHARNPGSLLQRLVQAGVPVWLETRYRNAHNKVMVIDAGTAEPTVITGSYNFTWSAQAMNAENLVVIRGNPALAERYASNWKRHQSDAEPLESR